MDLTERVRRSLSHRYLIDREVGHGGSSVVFRARDAQLDRVVAIKVLRPELWAGSVASDRFQREVRIVATMQHPNILPLFDSGFVDGAPYFVMPFVEGETLADRLRRDGPLPVGSAIDIALDVADGLGYAHERGIVHRDIKPGNILLTGDRAVIADFGIARAMDPEGSASVTSTGYAPGTPTYMSPEQAGAGDVGPRSDLYSLGCVLYEALAGEPPFTGRTVQAVVARHMYADPPSVALVRSAVPQGVADVIETTLHKMPTDRYASAADFTRALREARSSAPAARPRIRRPRRSWSVPAWSVVALALGAIVWTVSTDDPALDQDRVVVFPLARVGAADTSAAGWSVALAIGTALEHTEPLRWMDGWLWLPEEVRRDPSRATPDVLRDVARQLGAGRYLGGVIRSEADSTDVSVRVYDADGRVVAQETARGGADRSLPDLGLAATVLLLPHLLEPGREVDLTPLTDRAPSAIALTIQGDRAYRRSRFGEAFEFYGRALAEDSLLAIAAARGAQAGVWEERHEDAVRLADLAVRHGEALPTRHAHLVRGVQAYLAGDPALATAEVEAALAEDPGWTEAATLLGEIRYHLLPVGIDAEAAARRAFEGVIEGDSMFTPPLPHLAEMAIRRGEMPAARELVERLTGALGADAPAVRRLEVMAGCVAENGIGVDGWRELVAAEPAQALIAGTALATGGAQPQCAEGALRAALEVPDAGTAWGALLGLNALLLAQGRVDELQELLDSRLADGARGVYNLYVFDAAVTDAFRSRAEQAERIIHGAYGDLYRGANGVNLWLMGVWLAARGDADMPHLLAQEMELFIPGPREREARLLASALEAHAALARGDGAEAIRRYADLTPTAPLWRYYWELHEALAPERIRWARALLQAGDPQGALDVASIFDHPAPITYVAYIAPSLAIRLAAAEALGLEDLSARFRQRLARLGWPGAHVPLSPTGPPLGTSPSP